MKLKSDIWRVSHWGLLVHPKTNNFFGVRASLTQSKKKL